ncbi:MAG: hypothetical protein DMG49_18700 [Acidobacteria bacterium]|nr:MAG: hypothetical protein DMG49_18700 [Acidobacteriota bacterium]
MEPSRSSNFKTRDLMTGDGGDNGEQNQECDVTRQAIRSIRFAMRGHGDVFERIAHMGHARRRIGAR